MDTFTNTVCYFTKSIVDALSIPKDIAKNQHMYKLYIDMISDPLLDISESEGVSEKCHMSASEVRESLSGREGRIDLAYRNLTCLPDSVLKEGLESCRILDLTYNCFNEFLFLVDTPHIETLILDHNQLTTHVTFPYTPSLTTLWVNHNNISNLTYFISHIERSFPHLRVLSLMNNEAAPSYFNNKTYMEHLDYRHFVISRLKELRMLDEKIVTEKERKESERIYPTTISNFLRILQEKFHKFNRVDNNIEPITFVMFR